jgi:hypothetical protein
LRHNRRTCAILKEHVALLQRASTVWRARFLAALTDAGVGVGSLFNYEDSYRGVKTRFLVMAINWDALTFVNSGAAPFRVRDLANLTAPERWCAAPWIDDKAEGEGCFGGALRHHMSANRMVTLLSAKADISPPDGWVDEGMTKADAKSFLKEQRSWQWDGTSGSAIEDLLSPS